MLAYQKLAALVGVLFLMAVGLSACDNAAQEEKDTDNAASKDNGIKSLWHGPRLY